MSTDAPRPTFLTDVALPLTREQAERLFALLGELPAHAGWDTPHWSLTPWVVLADALGHPVPDSLRAKATA